LQRNDRAERRELLHVVRTALQTRNMRAPHAPNALQNFNVAATTVSPKGRAVATMRV
jgi:hypothetical protein